MNKVTSLVLIGMIFAATNGLAQFSKGSMLVGGTFGANFSTEKSTSGNVFTTQYRYRSFGLTPTFGYFIIDRLAVGGGLSLNLTGVTYTGNNSSSNSASISLQPFIRYYIKNFYGQATAQLGDGSNKSTNTNVPTTTKYTTSGWSLGVGYAYFITDHVSVEPQVVYAWNRTGYPNSDSNSNGGLFLKAGFQIYMAKR